MKLCITFRNRSVPFTYRSNYSHLLCLYTVIICQQSGVASLKIELLSLLINDLLTIIRDYVGWSLTGNRKEKNVCNFWPKKWSRKLSGGRLQESS